MTLWDLNDFNMAAHMTYIILLRPRSGIHPLYHFIADVVVAGGLTGPVNNTAGPVT